MRRTGATHASGTIPITVPFSTVRIGPFRAALIMNLEPLTAVVLSAIALGDVITPLQALGSGLMLAALWRFKSGDDDAVTARSCLLQYTHGSDARSSVP
ncbi:MAG: EamA family transporter [Xanthobacteraceae bacterium]